MKATTKANVFVSESDLDDALIELRRGEISTSRLVFWSHQRMPGYVKLGEAKIDLDLDTQDPTRIARLEAQIDEAENALAKKRQRLREARSETAAGDFLKKGQE